MKQVPFVYTQVIKQPHFSSLKKIVEKLPDSKVSVGEYGNAQ
jgi:hypothetical protein